MSQASEKKGYDGIWYDHYTPINILVENLREKEQLVKAVSNFWRNLFVFVLVLLYSFRALDPSARRGLIASSLDTFVNTPFDVEGEGRVQSFLDIHNEGEFYAWTRNVLVKNIYNHDLSFDTFNRVLWGVRFRQIRMKNEITAEHACDDGVLPPVIARANIPGIACKYSHHDLENILDVNYGKFAHLKKYDVPKFVFLCLLLCHMTTMSHWRTRAHIYARFSSSFSQ